VLAAGSRSFSGLRADGDVLQRRFRFLDVRHGKPEELDDVLIVERIEHLPARTPGSDEPHPPQQPQLMRDSGLADSHEARDVAHAQIAGCQGIQNPDACGITEDTERLGDLSDRSIQKQLATPGGSLAVGQMGHLAAGV
jgi:hypothetical protein